MNQVAPVGKLAKEDRFTEYVPHGGQDKVKLSVAIVRSILSKPTRSGKVASETDCMKFVAMCQARRLNPFEGDAFLVGYDSREGGAEFSMITAHQAFLKRAEVSPEFDGMQSGVMVRDSDGNLIEVEGDYHSEDQALVGGWAKVYYKTRKYPMYKRAPLHRFQKETKFWKDNPAAMICKVAEADALRSAFPTTLGGLYIKEEMPTFAANGNPSTVLEPKFDEPAKPKALFEPPQAKAEPSDNDGGEQIPGAEVKS